ncbi:MAG: CHAD domain-containing protein [Caulobacterales bacterium]|nr:CHAD domain-containing protein [Caulobacterales bacterium]
MDDAERIGPGLRRILVEELSSAAARLRTEDARDVAVHEARKSFKKTRSALRLAREALSSARFAKSNRRVRTAGRELSGLRDARVLVQTVDRLSKDAGGAPATAGIEALREAMAARYDALAEAGSNQPALMSEVAGRMERLSKEIGRWPLERGVGGAVRRGYRRMYAAGRDMFARAYREPGDEAFHDWRKRVKDYWYATRILRPLWPAVMRPVAEEAGFLSELIGDDHDLAMLQHALVRPPHPIRRRAERAAVDKLIASHRGRLRREAWTLGARLYGERPEAFSRRMQAYWRARRHTL